MIFIFHNLKYFLYLDILLCYTNQPCLGLWLYMCMKFVSLELFFNIFYLSYSYIVIRKVENLTNSSSELLACRWVLIIDLGLLTIHWNSLFDIPVLPPFTHCLVLALSS